MPKITISADSNAALKDAAKRPWEDDEGQRNADGTWTIEVDDEVYERLDKHRRKGETYDHVIARMVAALQARRQGHEDGARDAMSIRPLDTSHRRRALS